MSFSVDMRPPSDFRRDKNKNNRKSRVRKFDKNCANPQDESKLGRSDETGTDFSRLQSFLRSAPDAAITTTTDGQINSFSKCAEKLFGYHHTEILGRNIAQLFDPTSDALNMVAREDPSERAYWCQIRSQPFIHAVKKTGELVPVEVSLKTYRADNEDLRIYYVKNATLRNRQEQRIAELEREIAFLSRHSVLGELATAITHELSQPLTAIANYTAAASRCWGNAPTEHIEDGLELIAKAGEQAKRAWLIMHRLRQLLQHRGFECAVEDLRLALDDAIQLATLGADEHGISIAIDVPEEPVTVRMDRVQIQILLANLIRNAVDELRASNGERKMWISLTIKGNDIAEVCIADTGPGIAPEVFENIFDPFLTTKPQGLGIGLAVSRRIALAHGGRLAARNRAEGGAAFSFLIPVSAYSESEKVGDE